LTQENKSVPFFLPNLGRLHGVFVSAGFEIVVSGPTLTALLAIVIFYSHLPVLFHNNGPCNRNTLLRFEL